MDRATKNLGANLKLYCFGRTVELLITKVLLKLKAGLDFGAIGCSSLSAVVSADE
jgi:hypothetical protein